jgi:hypothetical protein
MLRRELSIMFRAQVTWLQAALSALLVGHSFVLATDLYSAGSRSALANRLMSREFDPLLGIVRPTLGGLYFAISLLGAVVAVRPLAIEKERRTFHSLLLQTASPMRVLAAQAVAGVMSLGLQAIAPIGLFGLWVLLGGHLAMGETAAALLGQALYVILVAALAMAAAAWTNTLAQAATATIVVIAASWAIDASEGFAALAWLGRALDWSVSTHLTSLERGTLSLGACLWMGLTTTGAFAIAYVGVRFDVPRRRRVALSILIVMLTAGAGVVANRVRMVFDCTELNRVSLPPAVIAGLRELPGALSLEVYLDRDDARRQQLEGDVIAKLRLARSDVEVWTPLDEQSAPAVDARDEGYGRIIVRVGDQTRATYSTSRKEIVTLLFEAAGRPVPDWSTAEYPGYPLVIDGQRRTLTLLIAYLGLPAACILAGLCSTRAVRGRS